jgi:hypothetical protein
MAVRDATEIIETDRTRRCAAIYLGRLSPTVGRHRPESDSGAVGYGEGMCSAAMTTHTAA